MNLLLALWLPLEFLAAPAPAPDQLVAVKVGRVITVSGEDIAPATIIIEAGRIRAVGKDLEIPMEARVFQFPEGVAMPGIVDCHSTTGLRVPQENLADVPYISVIDGIDPSSPGLENARRDGVTTVHVLSSNATRIGGQGAIIRSHGTFVDAMVVKAPSAMKMSLRPPRNETRMGNMAALRKVFHDLFVRVKGLQPAPKDPEPIAGKPAARAALESFTHPRPNWAEIDWDKIPADKIAERDRPLVDVVRGKLPVFIHCAQASDVFKAFELIDTHGLDATLVLGPDAWKLGPILAAREHLGAVVLDPVLEVWETDPETGAERRHVTPLALHQAGIQFSLQVQEDSAFNRGPSFSRRGGYHFWHQAATLVKHGIPRAEALRAITLTPAETIGLAHRVGSIEAGKDGNVVVFSGDPLDARSWVEIVLVEGTVAYEKTKDKDLELLLRKPERRF